MARTDTLDHFLTDVADSIRTKTGSSESIQASSFDTAISLIPSGTAVLQTKSSTINTTASTTITPDTGYNGMSSITVQVVDSNLTAGNIKKDVAILGVTGTYEGGGTTPTGTISITSNGTVDVTNYASASVAVPLTEYVPAPYVTRTCGVSAWDLSNTISFAFLTAEYTVDTSALQIGIAPNSSTTNTINVINADLIISSTGTSSTQVSVTIRCNNKPSSDIDIAIFGIEAITS
jgi:hypothetical protein